MPDAPSAVGPAVAAAGVPPERRYLNTIARGSALSLVGSVVSAAATFAFALVVARSTSPEQAGVLFSLTSVFVIALAVCRLGVPMGLVYFIARHRTTGDQHLIHPLARHVALVVGSAAAGLGLAGVAVAEPLAEALVGAPDAGAAALLRTLAACLVFAALTDVGIGVTRGLGVMRPLVLVDRIGRPVTQLLAAAVLAWVGAGSAFSLGLAWVLPWVPAAGVAVLWARALVRAAERRSGSARLVRPAPGQRAAFWRFVAPRSVGSVAQLVLQRSDIVLLGVLSGPREAALYTVATRFLVFGQLGANALGTAIQPKLAQLLVQEDRDGARAVYRVSTVWLVLLSWPVYLLSSVFAPELLAVFGQEYATGAPVAVVVVLSLVMLLATGTGPVDVVLGMAGRASWTMLNSLAALVLNTALNLLLIPRFGIMGAAVAWAAAIALNNLLPVLQLQLTLGLHPFGRSGATAACWALVCFAAVPLAGRALGAEGAAGAVAAAGVGAGLYAGGLWRWRDRFELRRRSGGRRPVPAAGGRSGPDDR